MLDYLLKQGANIDARNLNGVTPLMIAVLRSRKRNGELSPQHADIVKTLLAKGATTSNAPTADKPFGVRRGCDTAEMAIG